MNSTADSGLLTGLAQVFRERRRFYRRRVNQHLDTLIPCLCPVLPHALQGCEQPRDTLLAFLTIETLVADDFECDDLNIANLPLMTGADCAEPSGAERLRLRCCAWRRCGGRGHLSEVPDCLDGLEEIVAAAP